MAKSTDTVVAKHKDYQKFLPLWQKCRTVIEGEEAVKEAGPVYLPMLQDQGITAYDHYKMRAMFYEATGRTLQGLVGALHHKQPTLTNPDGKEDDTEFFDSLVPSHIPFRSFMRDISEEILTTSRIGLLVDVPPGGGDPFIASYAAEDIINWRCQMINGKEMLTMVVLEECYAIEGMYETKYAPQWRVLKMTEGKYEMEVWRKQDRKEEYYLHDTVVPTRRGQALDRIPFFFINSGGTSAYTYRPPLLPLANVNLSHYRNSADLEHGRHFTGLPTPYAAGFKGKGAENLYVGSTKAWVSDDPQAKAGYLEFTGQGLTALEKALETKEGLMAILGARLLEAPKNVSESADNQMVRRSSENSIIANIADTESEGLTQACKFAAEWKGLNPEKVAVTVQRDYLDVEPDAQLLGELMKQLQAGAISYDTFFYNLQRMKLTPAERTAEDELDLVDTGRFGGLAGQLTLALQGTGLPGGPPIEEPEPKKPGNTQT